MTNKTDIPYHCGKEMKVVPPSTTTTRASFIATCGECGITLWAHEKTNAMSSGCEYILILTDGIKDSATGRWV
jgi:hypothetical protein